MCFNSFLKYLKEVIVKIRLVVHTYTHIQSVFMKERNSEKQSGEYLLYASLQVEARSFIWFFHMGDRDSKNLVHFHLLFPGC